MLAIYDAKTAEQVYRKRDVMALYIPAVRRAMKERGKGSNLFQRLDHKSEIAVILLSLAFFCTQMIHEVKSDLGFEIIDHDCPCKSILISFLEAMKLKQ